MFESHPGSYFVSFRYSCEGGEIRVRNLEERRKNIGAFFRVKSEKLKLFLYKPKRRIGKCIYSPIHFKLRHLVEVMVSLTSWHFTAVKNPRYPLSRRANGTQNLYGGYGERIKLLFLPGFKPRTVRPVSVFTLSIEPSRFIFLGFIYEN